VSLHLFEITLFVARYGFRSDAFPLGSVEFESFQAHFLNINLFFCRGEAWHRLRNEDFSQVHLEHSQALVDLIQQMMRTDPTQRLTSAEVEFYPPICRARARMEVLRVELSAQNKNIWGASPLASVPPGFLEDILATDSMEVDNA
jgi:mitosis inhibitor protein kinase SWE1